MIIKLQPTSEEMKKEKHETYETHLSPHYTARSPHNTASPLQLCLSALRDPTAAGMHPSQRKRNCMLYNSDAGRS